LKDITRKELVGLFVFTARREQLFQGIAAQMTEILPLDEIEDKFADVLTAVADTLDRAGAEQRGQNKIIGSPFI